MLCPLCGKEVREITFTGYRDDVPALGSVRAHESPCSVLAALDPPHCPTPDSVYLSDCLDGMRRMGGESVDLIVTDPPYLIDYATNYRKDKAHDFCRPIQNDHNPELIAEYMRECYRILKRDSAAYVFCSSKTLEIFKKYAQATGFTIKNTIIWVKNNWTAGDLKAQFGQQYEPVLLLNKGRAIFHGSRVTDVWEFPRVAGKVQLHQNQKPVELIQRCIEKHSLPGDLVFDGFMGSGTTAVAARQEGRRFIGFEIEPRYFWIIHNRLCEDVKQ